ncbi:MAG: bifunctional precorrin-2 dehydrogenase/sirohydrochlorin ferrochelatase [Synergistaceae bacterium]|nr:bifunctional precorrin-2 dehydrogenase/sirohydrochlorin ferrochelatase [Synergistaceae bacterium]
MSTSKRPPFFPMMIDLNGRHVLIIGGGVIASRRADTLLRCGAKITAVSPDFSPEFPENTHRIKRPFRPEDITSEISLVVSAADNREVNHFVYGTAKSKLIPVNVADCQEECDFFFPSMINSQNIAACVCSAGVSPSLTHRLSERLRKVWQLWIDEENNT